MVERRRTLSLLLTFFLSQMTELIANGHLYLAMPPFIG